MFLLCQAKYLFMNTWLPACICWSATVDSITASHILFQVTFIMLPVSPLFLCSHRRSSSVRYQSVKLVLILREDWETSEHLHAAGKELLIGEINEVGYVWISSLGLHARVRSRGRRGLSAPHSVFVAGAPVTRFSVACWRRDNVINGACWEQWRGWHGESAADTSCMYLNAVAWLWRWEDVCRRRGRAW